MPNPSQEPLASSSAQHQDLKDIEDLFTFNINIESQNSKVDILKTSDHIQIKVKMPNPSQEPLASSKSPNEDLKDMGVLCIFKTKIESQNVSV